MSKENTSLKLTPRGRHAVMALIELATQGKDRPVPLSKIASSGNISLSYLEQLFAGLRRHGLVRSYRGPGGGYILARAPSEILIAEILVSAEDCAPAKRLGPGEGAGDANPQAAALWNQVGHILHAYLQRISLEDVTNDNLSNHPTTNKLFETLR